MKSIRIIITVFLLVGLMTTTSEAVWPIYYEPKFNGTILDIETKQPIEGAVVVAEYKTEFMGLGAGHIPSFKNIRETLTDKDGNFHIPSYTSLLLPFTWQDWIIFLIYKPGYASIEGGFGLNDCFTGKEPEMKEISPWFDPLLRKKYKIVLRRTGIVELPKLKTREERLRSIPSLPDELNYLEEQSILTQLINEENRKLGLQESDPYKARDFILHMDHGR